MEQWWSEVFDRLREPTWTTDVGVPAVLSFGALVLALLLVKWQMSDARRLARDQRLLNLVEGYGRVARRTFLQEEGYRSVGPTHGHIYAGVWPALQSPTEEIRIAIGPKKIFSMLEALANDIDRQATILDEWMDHEPDSFSLKFFVRNIPREARNLAILLSERLINWDGKSDIDAEPAGYSQWLVKAQLYEHNRELWEIDLRSIFSGSVEGLAKARREWYAEKIQEAADA